MENTYRYLSKGSMKYKGIIKKMNDFINIEQLKNRDLWKKFVDVYRYKSDSDDIGWKGEFWGKMMRGACLCYKYQNSKILYRILKETVIDMLSAIDEDGRFSSYRKEVEFSSWDMWGRKYIMTSMIYFYKVCHEKELKKDILKALCRHADYILSHIGKEDNKINITDTSSWWLGVNSSSILEAFVDLYRISKKDKYLSFGKYIVEEGGIREGNLLNEVKEGKLPYEFSEAKAYETMSFFEGVMEYAKETDNKQLLDISLTFFKRVEESEISIIGNAGAFEENFSNTCITQTNKVEKYIQETCVAVTWMRIQSKLMLLTGDIHYYDNFVHTAVNCFMGSINYNKHSSCAYYENKRRVEPMPFDSYSPLYNDRRGTSTGGLQKLNDGSYYGCCACIGSAGIGLISLNSIIYNKDNIIVNDYYIGRVNAKASTLKIEGNYLVDGYAKVTLKSRNKQLIKFRIPSWSNAPYIKVSKYDKDNKTIIKEEIIKVKDNTYFEYMDNGDKSNTILEFFFNPSIKLKQVNKKVAYTYGELVLAVSEEDNPNIVLEDLKSEKISSFEITKSKLSTYIAFKAKYNKKEIIFKDYASSGKSWDLPNNRLTVWIDVR